MEEGELYEIYFGYAAQPLGGRTNEDDDYPTELITEEIKEIALSEKNDIAFIGSRYGRSRYERKKVS